MSLLLLSLFVAAAYSAEWNYVDTPNIGPSNWPDQCLLSTSIQQSPIDINTGGSHCVDFDDFNLQGYDEVDVELFNNGHTVELGLEESANALLTGGGLVGTYKLAQLHFHWGSVDGHGSEHTLNGQQYPMEVHFVHYNTIYGSLGEAADECDGLAVLGFFFEIDGENNTYKVVFDELPVEEGGPELILEDLDLTELMGDTSGRFYRYDGSLTTPPCYQSVTWTVFEKPINISTAQLGKLREVVDQDDHSLSDNFRPVQPLNGRLIFKNKAGGDDSSEEDSSSYRIKTM